MCVRLTPLGIRAKYPELADSYKSIQESLVHGGIANDVRVTLKYVDSQEVESQGAPALLGDVDAVLGRIARELIAARTKLWPSSHIGPGNLRQSISTLSSAVTNNAISFSPMISGGSSRTTSTRQIISASTSARPGSGMPGSLPAE